MKYLLLYSGGLDSFLLNEYMNIHMKEDDTLQLVYYDLNSRYSKQELKKVQSTHPDIIVDKSFDFSDIEQEDAYIPNRNLLLATHALGKYDADRLLLGNTLSDRAPDNKVSMFEDLMTILTESLDRRVQFYAPFDNLYKSEVATWYTSRGSADDLAKDTFSCYTPKSGRERKVQLTHIANYTNECFACPACFRKNVVLNSVGLHLPFNNRGLVLKYHNEFKNLVRQTPRTISTINYINSLHV